MTHRMFCVNENKWVNATKSEKRLVFRTASTAFGGRTDLGYREIVACFCPDCNWPLVPRSPYPEDQA